MTVKRNDETVSGECEKYQLDLTDYVRGDMTFLTKEKQQQLFDHLRQCASCRQDFFDWEETFGVLVTEHHLARPEIKKKMNDLIEQFKSPSTVQDKAPLDVKVEIGIAAGKINDYLKSSGPTPIPITELRQKTGLLDYPFYEGMSWLVMNDKATYTKGQENRPNYVSSR